MPIKRFEKNTNKSRVIQMTQLLAEIERPRRLFKVYEEAALEMNIETMTAPEAELYSYLFMFQDALDAAKREFEVLMLQSDSVVNQTLDMNEVRDFNPAITLLGELLKNLYSLARQLTQSNQFAERPSNNKCVLSEQKQVGAASMVLFQPVKPTLPSDVADTLPDDMTPADPYNAYAIVPYRC